MRTIFSLGLCGLLFIGAGTVAQERPDHFKGQPADSLEQAFTHLSDYNARLRAILAKGELTAQDSHQVHELTYTLENALGRLDSELEALAEVLEALHVASETAELDKIKALGAQYLSQSEPFTQR